MAKQQHFELLKTLDGHTDAVWGSCTSSKGDQLYTASWDGTIKSWDIITGEETQSCVGHKGKVFCVAAGDAMQGSILVSGGEDRSIRSWNMVDGTCEGTMDDAHDGSVVSLTAFLLFYSVFILLIF
jgi:WD40 repeat protein